MICTDDLIGVRWEEGGRDPSKGLDCLGLALVVLERMGLPAFDPWPALEEAWREGFRDLEQAIPEGWEQLPEGEKPEPGDVLITQQGGTPTHIVVMLEQGRVISALDPHGVVLLPLRWATAQLHSAWRCQR